MKVAAVFVALVVSVVAFASVAHAQPVAIVGAKIHIKPGQVIENGTLVIERGRITAVGAGARVPGNAKTIDGTGKVVTAGLVDGFSGVGLVGIDLEPQVVDGRFGAMDTVHSDPVHASYQARDGFDARDVNVAIARAGGLTIVIAAPAGGLVAGQSAAFALDGSADPVRAPVAMHVALGASGAGALGGSRGKSIELLRELLDDARTFRRDRAAYEKNAKRRMIADRLDLEALQPVLARTVPLVVDVNGESDIRAALRIAKQFNVRIAIAGGAEAWRVAKELAAARVPVLLDPTANLPSALDASEVSDEAATILNKAGVQVAISTLGASWGARTLRQLAGNAVARGLPWDKALASITTVPATLYGLKGRGTLERGAVADVVVWSGDPLELSTAADAVIIAGVVQSLDNHQTKLLQRYRRVPPATAISPSPAPRTPAPAPSKPPAPAPSAPSTTPAPAPKPPVPAPTTTPVPAPTTAPVPTSPTPASPTTPTPPAPPPPGTKP
ncbi:MAG TPA: amidohydrolase family protein [Kofleriaceae bacterium]